MYKIRSNDLKYTQNFLKDSSLVDYLIRKSDINAGDTVLDIGAGKGVISTGLTNIGAKPVPIELDSDLITNLNSQFSNTWEGDFLNFSLPRKPYKVFSNIPFNITNAIVRKLFFSKERSPEGASLVMEKDAANKFLGQPYGKTTAMGVQIGFEYDVSLVHEFKRSDYSPNSNVDTVLIAFAKNGGKSSYTNRIFVEKIFNRGKTNLLKTLKDEYGYRKVRAALIQTVSSLEKNASDLSIEEITSLQRSLNC